VYGLSDETRDNLRSRVFLDTLQLKKSLNINTAVDPAVLAKHPYLSYGEAKAIINFRKQHGPYLHWKDLQKLYALADSTILKIKPYIQLDEENP
jgi:DNA uptake protein ComE-like DNA-binding protein